MYHYVETERLIFTTCFQFHYLKIWWCSPSDFRLCDSEALWLPGRRVEFCDVDGKIVAHTLESKLELTGEAEPGCNCCKRLSQGVELRCRRSMSFRWQRGPVSTPAPERFVSWNCRQRISCFYQNLVEPTKRFWISSIPCKDGVVVAISDHGYTIRTSWCAVPCQETTLVAFLCFFILSAP